jgi:hypothetical protein
MAVEFRNVVAVAIFALGARTVFAQSDPPAVSASAEGNAVTFGGQVLMRIRTGAGHFSPEQRADQVSQRLIPILSLKDLKADDITMAQTRKYQDATILVRGRLLVTVDKGLAQANGNNDPGDLARSWAANLRGVLPGLSVAPNVNQQQ